MRRGRGVLLAALSAALVLGGCSVDPSADPSPSTGQRASLADSPSTPRTAPRPRTPSKSGAPNVLLITSDDQTAVEMRWMPKTRKLLGRRGVTFTDMVAPHPNCCPARAQILSGQYAQNNGVRKNSPPFGGHESFDASTALPVWLQAAGYRTAFVGKYLHGYDAADPVEPGWDHFWPIVSQPLSRYWGPDQIIDGAPVTHPRTTYHTRLVGDQTRELVDELAGEQPFFLWSSYVAPHGSCETGAAKDCSGPPPSEPRDARKFRGVRLPSLDSPSFNERAMGDKPRRIRGRKVHPRAQQRLFTARLRALASLDRQVAKTVHALRRAGELDDTIIAFTSDNGYMFGEHRQRGKVLAYEESLRVPLLVRGPGLPRGVRRQQTVSMIDLAPTIAARAGATAMRRVDGVDLWPWAARNRPQGDRALLVQAGRNATDPDDAWQFRGVRTRRFTYVDWMGRGHPELYDRRTDPWQLHSLHGQRRHRALQRRMARLLDRLGSCAGRTCRVGVRR